MPKGFERYLYSACGGAILGPWTCGIRGNEIADELARGGLAMGFLGPEPALGVSRRDIQQKLSCLLVNQQWASWRGLGDTQRQARELISGLSLGTKVKLLSFNDTIQGCNWPSHST